MDEFYNGDLGQIESFPTRRAHQQRPILSASADGGSNGRGARRLAFAPVARADLQTVCSSVQLLTKISLVSFFFVWMDGYGGSFSSNDLNLML